MESCFVKQYAGASLGGYSKNTFLIIMGNYNSPLFKNIF